MSIARVLKHVRNNRHFEIADVAHSTGISADSLADFEEGVREPSFRQYEALAEVYGIPSYLFETEALPNLPENVTDFRRSTPKPARLSPDGMKKIWAAEHVAQATRQLLDVTKATLAKWNTKLEAENLSTKTSSEMREFFDSWRGERQQKFAFTGTNEQIFLGCLRLFIESQGTIFRVNQAPPEDFFGFYLAGKESLPTIFVNRKISSVKAQLFTAVHEYAHHIAGLSGISNPFSVKNDIERACNHFAVNFLAPQNEFSNVVERFSRQIHSDVFQLVDAVSTRTLLSKHATAIRLLETGYVSQKQLNSWLAYRAKLSGRELKNEDSEEPENNFGQIHAKLVGEIGYLPTYLAGIALREKLISSVDIVYSISLSEIVQERALSLASRRMEAAVS